MFGHHSLRVEMGRSSSPGVDVRPSGGGKAGRVSLAIQPHLPFLLPSAPFVSLGHGSSLAWDCGKRRTFCKWRNSLNLGEFSLRVHSSLHSLCLLLLPQLGILKCFPSSSASDQVSLNLHEMLCKLLFFSQCTSE